MSDPTSRIPNLYQLLGLPGLEPDLSAIQAAAERLTKRSGKPEDAARIEKIVALTQKYLLDPHRKIAYDQQWRATYGVEENKAPQNKEIQHKEIQSKGAELKQSHEAPKIAAAAASRESLRTAVGTADESSTQWDYSQLDALLPTDDPMAAFDMASFLRGTNDHDPMSAEADLTRLLKLLGDESPGQEPPVEAVALVESQPVEPVHDAGVSLSIGPAKSSGPSTIYTKKARKRRQQSILLGATCFIAGLAGLGALASYLLRSKGKETVAQATNNVTNKTDGLQNEPDAADAANPMPNDGADDTDAMENSDASDGKGKSKNKSQSQTRNKRNSPKGSGLAKPGEGGMLDIQQVPKQPTNNAAMPDNSAPKPAGPNDAMAAGNMTPAMPNEPAPAPMMNNAPMTNAAPMTNNAPMTNAAPAGSNEPASTPATNANAPAPPPDMPLTANDKKAWKEGMEQVRTLIGQQKFDDVNKKLTELKSTAKTPLQREQHERLQEVAKLVQEFHEAMIAAIEGLSGADTFKIGTSTIASFVEGNREKLTVRVSGDRKSYSLPDVPPAMAIALVDLKLDIAHATSLAKKGAYIMTHPKNKAMIERGKQMLNEAASAGAIPRELAVFYDDDYSLSKAP